MVSFAHENNTYNDSLNKLVIDYIINAIGTGKLSAGAKVNETLIARELNISRAPIREAIRELATQGILQIEPRKGATVPTMNEREINETYSLRACLESMAVGLAIKKITEKDIDKLERISKKMNQTLKNNDIKKFIKLNEEFHNIIRENCGHVKLQKILNSFLLMARLYLLMTNQDLLNNLKLDVEYGAHDPIVAAMRKRNATLAERLMEKHIKNSGDRLIAVLQKE